MMLLSWARYYHVDHSKAVKTTYALKHYTIWASVVPKSTHPVLKFLKNPLNILLPNFFVDKILKIFIYNSLIHWFLMLIRPCHRRYILFHLRPFPTSEERGRERKIEKNSSSNELILYKSAWWNCIRGRLTNAITLNGIKRRKKPKREIKKEGEATRRGGDRLSWLAHSHGANICGIFPDSEKPRIIFEIHFLKNNLENYQFCRTTPVRLENTEIK